jgi:hypothetical protein
VKFNTHSKKGVSVDTKTENKVTEFALRFLLSNLDEDVQEALEERAGPISEIEIENLLKKGNRDD